MTRYGPLLSVVVNLQLYDLYIMCLFIIIYTKSCVTVKVYYTMVRKYITYVLI